ncbi:anthrone oxygenase family protein [Streptomyces thermocarboxydus]
MAGRGAVASVVGGALFLCGSFGPTVAANIPRNERPPGSTRAVRRRPLTGRSTCGWTRWNHVRAVASAGSSLTYLLVLTG